MSPGGNYCAHTQPQAQGMGQSRSIGQGQSNLPPLPSLPIDPWGPVGSQPLCLLSGEEASSLISHRFPGLPTPTQEGVPSEDKPVFWSPPLLIYVLFIYF